MVRLQFGSSSTRIMYEDMQDVDDLVAYCQAIYVARRAGELVKEETLYRRLIKIYRTPALLVTLTQREKRSRDAPKDGAGGGGGGGKGMGGGGGQELFPALQK
eukprot:g23047.t1